jgi:hypothetical protein
MRVWTPWGDLSYPNLDKARDNGYGTNRKFSACLRLPVGWWDLESDLMDAIMTVGLDFHGTLAFNMPVRSSRYDPHPLVRTQSVHRPPRTPFVEFYPGRRCRLLVEPWAWSHYSAGKGVALALLAVEAGFPRTPEDQLARETARLAEETARLAQATADLARMRLYEGETG